MRVVRDRAEARWLPSRHRYALARLVAFLVLRRARSEPRPGLVLAVDRDQSTPENLAIGIWAWLTWTCYAAAILPGAWKLAAPILGLLVLQIAVLAAIAFPLFGRNLYANNHRISSVMLFVLLILASSYFATVSTWVRFVAWLVFAVFALNAIAAAILYPMRHAVRELEARCGA